MNYVLQPVDGKLIYGFMFKNCTPARNLCNAKIVINLFLTGTVIKFKRGISNLNGSVQINNGKDVAVF